MDYFSGAFMAVHARAGLERLRKEGCDLVYRCAKQKIAADKAGVAVMDRGFFNVDIQMRTNVPHIFAIGDIVGQLGEIALAIEMGADAVDIGKTIHPHPTLGESIGMAAEVAHGSCTDLPPSKR
jgi:dihydrolipoamide dehydrogenase